MSKEIIRYYPDGRAELWEKINNAMWRFVKRLNPVAGFSENE